MASFTSSPLSAQLLQWMSLFLSLSPLWARREFSTVKVNGTTIVGKSQLSAGNVTVEFFGGEDAGIPFAEPPVGELRFAPPMALDTLGRPIFNATAFGAPCVQFGVDDSSEDCLTLNIFRPSDSVLSTLTLVPVLLCIYGGGFELGASSLYDASEIIAQSVLRGTPIIYVSINCRVGPFGFPQGTEAGERGAVNLGLKDELAALSWVQKHISAFGGDPIKITLFGQSAGSVSIAYLYLNAGLENYGVQGTIMESGFARALPLFNASRRDPLWDAFVANTTECAGVPRGSTFPCLRNATTAELLSSWEAMATAMPDLYLFVPVLYGPDGLLPDLSSKLLSEGHF